MIKWYTDEEIAIEFDKIPMVSVRYPLPSMTKAEKKAISKYPFINKQELKVKLTDKKEEKDYQFVIPKGYCFDGMTIPRFAWTLIGVSKENNKGIVAALLHDYLCINKEVIENNRALSTNVFNALLITGGMNPVRRFVMKNSVACFQTLFCGWGKNKGE